MYFCFIIIISPWKRAGHLIWLNLNPHHPRMLCVKFSWNWPRGSREENEIVKSLHTDRRWRSKKLTWAQLKWAKKQTFYPKWTPYKLTICSCTIAVHLIWIALATCSLHSFSVNTRNNCYFMKCEKRMFWKGCFIYTAQFASFSYNKCLISSKHNMRRCTLHVSLPVTLY